jgi:methylmalonyl-CoA mutase
MADDILPLSNAFKDATEAEWLAAVDKALKGKGIDTITRHTADGLAVKPLYRESDFPSATDPLGAPGAAPYLRGPTAAPNRWLPWDIRQAFSHPDPATTNAEILRDLERGVSSVELTLDPAGTSGVQVMDLASLTTVLDGVDAAMAPVALDHTRDAGFDAAEQLIEWAQAQDNTSALKLDVNLDPLGALARTGGLDASLEETFERLAHTLATLAAHLPAAGRLRIDARMVHEAGGSDAQELGALIASAVDTLRRLPDAEIAALAPHITFSVALDANYGLGVAKLRAARRLWARCLEVLDVAPVPMRIQATTSARMLTRFDAWTNMLRCTTAAFAGAIGGADIVTVRPFNSAIGVPEELGRRIARNTQIIAMEESQLGRVADPAGGAWFTETFAQDLAAAAWEEFQNIEREGGYADSLVSGAFQDRVATIRDARAKDIAKRKVPITGISEFPLLDEIAAPTADPFQPKPAPPAPAPALTCPPLAPIHIAAPYEALRDAAAGAKKQPAIFLATLGPVAEHSARADFARNLFAAGGLAAKAPPVAPKSAAELAVAFKASGCRIAVLCGNDTRYAEEAAAAAAALKAAGVSHLWLAGKFETPDVDANIFMGCDVLHTLKLAHAELGLSQ